MRAWLCCRRSMGANYSGTQEGDGGDVEAISAQNVADVIRERKKKGGGATLGTLKRRLANAARRPRDSRPDRAMAELISMASNWSAAEIAGLAERALRTSQTRAAYTRAAHARAPAPTLQSALSLMTQHRFWCDVELVGRGWSLKAHKAILAARSPYFRHLLHNHVGGALRVGMSGPCASLSRCDMVALLHALYGGSRHKCYHESNVDDNLDIINMDNSNACGSLGCSCGDAPVEALLERVGARSDSLLPDIKYLLDSGEYADTWLSFSDEASAVAGESLPPERPIPAHSVILSARSTYFRNVISLKRSRGAPLGAAPEARGAPTHVCIDERVVPRRFVPALLHAAYTDQVDLNLIGRPNNATTSTSNATSSWSRSGNNKTISPSMLEDAFQLYEIARFVEMPICVQGCEDAIAEALCPEALAPVLRWAEAPHASTWVHRQAMLYLVEEFLPVLESPSRGLLPASALQAALQSDLLQAQEAAVLRALLRWAEAVSRGGGSMRTILSPLLPLLRTEHIPPTVLAPLVRRGLLPALPHQPQVWRSADAWLAHPPYRPPRSLDNYQDTLSMLLQQQPIPAEELALVRRARCLSHIPDTLYMVGSRPATVPSAAAKVYDDVLPAAARRAVRARCSQLMSAAHAVRPHADVLHQLALVATREVNLPDICAELFVPEMDALINSNGQVRENENVSEDRFDNTRWTHDHGGPSNDDLDSIHSMASVTHASLESVRRRELPAVVSEGQSNRPLCGWTISRRVPDVALAPNANTHLLTARDYPHASNEPWSGGLQLDLGDGATHAPRLGSGVGRSRVSSTHEVHAPENAYGVQTLARRPSPARLAPSHSSVFSIEGGEQRQRADLRQRMHFCATLDRQFGACSRDPVLVQDGRTRPHASLSSSVGSAPSVPRTNTLGRVSSREGRHSPNNRQLHNYRLETYNTSATSSRGPSPNSYA